MCDLDQHLLERMLYAIFNGIWPLAVQTVVTLDIDKAFKSLFLTNAFDGTEDVLVKDELLRMVHNEIKAFRDELKEWTLPDSVHGLMKQILPPKGIKRNFEGMELFDCDGPGEVTDQYFNISFF